MQLKCFEYYVPIYKTTIHENELIDDFDEWVHLLLDLMKLKNLQKRFRFWLLDGRQIRSLDQINPYESVLYMEANEQVDFIFWYQLIKDLKLYGEFKKAKYPQLTLRLSDMKDKEELLRYFSRRENLMQYFDEEIISESKAATQREIQKPIQITRLPEELQEVSIFHMDESDKIAYLIEIQDHMNMQKVSNQQKLKSIEDQIKHRMSNVRDHRRNQQKKHTLKDGEGEHFERIFLYSDEQTIEEIQEEALRKAGKRPRQFPKAYSSNMDPFQLLEKNKQFENIVNSINIQNIVYEKKMERIDIINYLTVFKALMDSDCLPKNNQVANILGQKNIEETPKLFISLKQLRRALPYLSLYKSTINTKKLDQIMVQENNAYIGFMEFLDLFKNVGNDELEEDA